jgi:predicted O-methyltransferase YrrM
MSTEQSQLKPEAFFRNVLSIYSPMAMLAGMQLDVFTPLKDGPMKAAELAGALGLQTEKLEILLYSLVRAELLMVNGGRFANTPEADAFLVRGRPGYLGSNHELYADLWGNLLKLAGSIRANAPLGKHDFGKMSDAELGAFLRGLHAGALATGAQLATLYGFGHAKALLDVGGGSGGVAIAACQACPELSATIVELPRVVPFAQACVEDAKLSKRIRVVAVDVVDKPPNGIFDVVVLRFFIQVLRREAARQALRNIAKAICSGGQIIIVGHILEDSRLSPVPAVGQSLVMLTIYEEGQAFTESQYRVWLSQAGFSDINIRYGAASAGASILSARKSS